MNIWKLLRMDLFGSRRRSRDGSRTGTDPEGDEQARPAWPGPLYLTQRVRRHHLIAVTSQLAALVDCNAPLVQGLELAAVDTHSSLIESLLLALRDDLASGLTLWQAMARLHRLFPRRYVDMVRAGEESGRLGDVLQDLIALERDNAESWSAARVFVFYYLPLVVLVQLVILLFLAKYIMPAFSEVLADLGIEEGPYLRSVITYVSPLSARASVYTILGTLLVVFCGPFVCRLLLGLRGTAGLAIAGFLLRIPWICGLVIRRNLGHISALLERLLAAGVPLDEALAGTADLDINPLYARLLDRVRVRVQQGSALADAFAGERHVPAGFHAMLSVGEKAGLVPEALARVAGLYRRQYHTGLRVLMDTLFPVGVLAVGTTVLWACLSMFSVLTTMADGLSMAF